MSTPPKPHIAVRYPVATHGPQVPQRIGIHDTESHDTAGIRDITGIAAFWERQGQGLGAHFIIDAAGNIGQGAPSNQVTWAIANHNTGTIHIELIGFARWTPKVWLARRRQMAAAKRLVAYLCVRWGIRPVHDRENGVCKHADFHDVPAGLYHSDPGVGFPFAWFLHGVRSIIRKAR